MFSKKAYRHQLVTEKEAIIFQETLNSPAASQEMTPTLPTITKTDTSVLLDVPLWKMIFDAMASVFVQLTNHFNADELFEFCRETYNSIVVTSANERQRKMMVDLSASSLQRGINKTLKQTSQKPLNYRNT